MFVLSFSQVITAPLQYDLDTENTERYSLLMDAPRFNNVEEAVETAKDNHMWAKMIRELDPTLSNDPHKMKRRIGDVVVELNVKMQLNGNKVQTYMMDSFMADQIIANDDSANQNS